MCQSELTEFSAELTNLRGPNWGLFFCAEIRAFTGLGRDFLDHFQSP